MLGDALEALAEIDPSVELLEVAQVVRVVLFPSGSCGDAGLEVVELLAKAVDPGLGRGDVVIRAADLFVDLVSAGGA